MEEKNLQQAMAAILDSLTDEQKEKARACKTFEELITLLGEMNVSLPDELMDEVAGGGQYVFTARKCQTFQRFHYPSDKQERNE